MPDNFANHSLPNVIIGTSFVWAAGWVGYLWTHRRADWPKSWALALVFCAYFSCGMSRLLHGTDADPFYVALSDWVAAVAGAAAVPFLPWAVLAVLSFPTPRQVEHAIRGNLQRHAVIREKERLERQKQKAERLSQLLVALFRQSPTIPDDIKREVDKIVMELSGDSDPTDYPDPSSGHGRKLG